MFEVYAVIASVLLPVGIISFIYFIYHVKNYTGNGILWTLIFESVATVLLGVLYMYSAIILSKSGVTNEVSLINNNIDDLAIINNTGPDEIEIPTFYSHNGEHSSEQTNEIEDTRNNKNEGSPSNFLQAYQNLVQTTIKKKLQNATKEQRGLYQRMLEHARDIKDEEPLDILENQNCFLKLFFYQALLVYSFVTSAISLINMCQMGKQCSKQNPSEPALKTSKSDNPSESFGERVSDDTSEKSSQNAAPVGPLFDEECTGSSKPNLEVFSVKNSSQVQPTAQQSETCANTLKNVDKEKTALTAGKCVTLLVFPMVLVVILYFLMKSGNSFKNTETDNAFIDFFPNFNNTRSNIQLANLVKNVNGEQENNSLTNIIRHVYTVINKFQDKHEHVNIPTPRGNYLFKSRFENADNSTNDCVGDKPILKTFDFVIFVLMFFAVIYYTKLTELKLTKTSSSNNINECILAFLILWAPAILDVIVSRFLTSTQPNTFSTILLLLGNMDRLYSAKQNINIYKKFIKGNALINPLKHKLVPFNF